MIWISREGIGVKKSWKFSLKHSILIAPLYPRIAVHLVDVFLGISIALLIKKKKDATKNQDKKVSPSLTKLVRIFLGRIAFAHFSQMIYVSLGITAVMVKIQKPPELIEVIILGA